MRHLILLFCLIGCTHLPKVESPLTNIDKSNIYVAYQIWLKHGLPDPSKECDIYDFELIYPTNEEDFHKYCKRCICGKDNSTCPYNYRSCGDECFAEAYIGFTPIKVIFRDKTPMVLIGRGRNALIHGWGHYVGNCSGINAHTSNATKEDNERFDAWLKEAESKIK